MKQYIKRWAAMAVLALGAVGAQASAASVSVNLSSAGVNVVVHDSKKAAHKHVVKHDNRHVQHKHVGKKKMRMDKRRQAVRVNKKNHCKRCR